MLVADITHQTSTAVHFLPWLLLIAPFPLAPLTRMKVTPIGLR